MHCLLNLRFVSRRMSAKQSPLPEALSASMRVRSVGNCFMIAAAVLLLTPGILQSIISPMFCGVMFSHLTCFTFIKLQYDGVSATGSSAVAAASVPLVVLAFAFVLFATT